MNHYKSLLNDVKKYDWILFCDDDDTDHVRIVLSNNELIPSSIESMSQKYKQIINFTYQS